MLHSRALVDQAWRLPWLHWRWYRNPTVNSSLLISCNCATVLALQLPMAHIRIPREECFRSRFRGSLPERKKYTLIGGKWLPVMKSATGTVHARDLGMNMFADFPGMSHPGPRATSRRQE